MNNKNWVFILIMLISLFSCFLFLEESLAATTQGMVVYVKSDNLGTPEYEPGIPVYRLWTGTGWTGEQPAQQVSTTKAITWVVLKQCPMRNEYILGTLDADNHLNIQVYNVTTGIWSNLKEVTTTCDFRFRGFDISYEYSSGQALIVFHTDKDVTDTNYVQDPQYYIWNGTSYDGPYTLDIPAWVSDSPVSGGTKGSPVWIRLKPWPTDVQTSDSIMLGILTDYENSGTSVKDYEVYYCIWRGTNWETNTAIKQLNAYSYSNGEGMDVLTYHCKSPNFRGVTYAGYAYAMGRWTELYKNIGATFYNHLLYSEYKVNSPASWGSVLYPPYPRLATSPTNTHFYWQRTSNRTPKKDTTSYIDSILGAVDSASKLQLNTVKEVAGTGLSFGYLNPVSTTNVATLTSRCFDVAMESSQNEGILVWGETGNSSFRYAYVNLPAVTWSGVLSGKNVGIAYVVSLAADPESDDLMLATINSAYSLYLTKWDGTANTWGLANQLTASASCNTYEPVAVVFKSYNPPPELKQNTYRWYANTDALQPATGLAGENTAVTVDNGTILRLRMNIGVTVADLTTPEKFALEFSTSKSGPWQRLAPAGTGKFWSRQTPDTTTGVNFTMCELALDSSGRPHIAYADATNKRTKYTYWTGSAWGSKTNPNSPESIGTYNTFQDAAPNIVLDGSGNPHLAYCCDSDGDGLSDLGYCKWTGSSWNIQVPLLDSQSLAGNKLGSRTAMDLDSSNNPHIGHRDYSTLGYTKYNGSSWSAEKLLDSATVCVSSDSMGLVIDSVNNIHIAYNENATANTKYVKWTGSSWTSPVVIDSNGYNAYSMDVNSNNYPYLMIGGNRLLKWNGSSWTTENLADILHPLGTEGNTSKGNNGVSIRMGADNNPYIVSLLSQCLDINFHN